MKKLFVAFTIYCFFVNAIFAQRDTISLSKDWSFAIDKNGKGVSENWFLKPLAQARTVQLPHTWNVEEANQNHYGWAWYQKMITAPKNWKNKSIVLQFGAVNHSAYVYLNGKKIGEHIGDGFNKFYIDLSKNIIIGKDNIITVAVNNDYGRNKAPFGDSFDWPNDGGLIRPVALIIANNPSASYIHATPTLNVANNSGKLKINLGYAQVEKNISELEVTITEENQHTKNVVLKTSAIPVWKNNEATVEFSLDNIHPWHFDRPNLYRVDVHVKAGKNFIDNLSTFVGFRELKFENGKTYLNGEYVKLMGIEWTAGSNPDYGFAESDSLIIAMGKLMKNVNCIFSRQHFQQGDVFFDFCDRNGILVQQEIPLWGPETPANDTIKNIAMKQLEEMVSTLYNHPSIFSWGVGNELRARDADMKTMIEKLLEKARTLDPTRHVAYVSNTLTQGFINSPSFVPDAAAGGDYLMMNDYGGSWQDMPVAKIGDYLDSVHMSYPSKPLFISEFGLCEPNFQGGDERRLEDLIYHMAIYESKHYVEGGIYFDLTDYRTHYPGTKENNKYRRRIHGVYDMYGNPKPSMQVLREYSAPLEVQGVRKWSKEKLNVLIYGSLGLPQHIVSGYKLYISDKRDNYLNGKMYELPEIKPGQKINFDVADLYNGKVTITIVRPTGYVVSQKEYNY